MKFFFSTLLFLPLASHASLINIIHEKQLKNANIIKAIFIDKYDIPKSLILVKNGSCDTKIDRRFLNICVTKKGELIQLSSNINFIRKSLNSFNTP